MKAFILLMLILFATSMASAEGRGMHLIHPQGSGLVLTVLERDGDLHATFAGQTWVFGTVIGRWPDGATNRHYKDPEFVLVPDPESVEKLPYFLLRQPPYFHRYKVRYVELMNGPAALRIAAGDAPVRRLLQRRVNHVTVSGRFLMEHYTVGVECDTPWARAVLLKAEPLEQRTTHNGVLAGC